MFCCCENNPHRSYKNLVTFGEVKVWVRVESSTGIPPNQGNDVMMEYTERETLSEVSIEVRLEEIVSPLEEIPSMNKLDTAQLGKFVRLIFEAEGMIDNGCHENCSRTSDTDDELVVLTGDGIQNGRAESGHGMVRDGERKARCT